MRLLVARALRGVSRFAFKAATRLALHVDEPPAVERSTAGAGQVALSQEARDLIFDPARREPHHDEQDADEEEPLRGSREDRRRRGTL